MHAQAESLDEGRAELFPSWYESLYGVDLALLFSSPVYYGLGVPGGDSSPVIVIPGFMHGDEYLIFLYAWLKRIGYQPYFSRIGFNANCPNILIQDMLNPVVDEARKKTRRRVHLIGHSLGGVIARSLAAQRPEDVGSVITLGSPLRQTIVRRNIFRESEMVRQYVLAQHPDRVSSDCMTSSCHCDFMTAVRHPVPRGVKVTAIYTRHDGLVDWKTCRTGNANVDVEVPGTHSGLAFNPAAYRIIAQRLAEATKA